MQQDCSQNVVRPASGCSKMVVNTGISVLMAWQIGGSNVVRRCGVVKNVFSVPPVGAATAILIQYDMNVLRETTTPGP